MAFLTLHELERYDRQIRIAEIGKRGQEKLKKARGLYRRSRRTRLSHFHLSCRGRRGRHPDRRSGPGGREQSDRQILH